MAVTVSLAFTLQGGEQGAASPLHLQALESWDWGANPEGHHPPSEVRDPKGGWRSLLSKVAEPPRKRQPLFPWVISGTLTRGRRRPSHIFSSSHTCCFSILPRSCSWPPVFHPRTSPRVWGSPRWRVSWVWSWAGPKCRERPLGKGCGAQAGEDALGKEPTPTACALSWARSIDLSASLSFLFVQGRGLGSMT